MQLSIVIPFYNEERNVAAFCEAIIVQARAITEDFELLLIDDGSIDGTWEKIMQCRLRESRVHAVRFSRNFGKEAALTAGLERAEGEAVLLMDGDFQHPPETIPILYNRLNENYDMVYAIREKRNEKNGFRVFFRKCFYWLWDHLADTKIPPDAGDFRILNRRAVDALNSLPERNRFMKGLYAWIGYKTAEVKYREAHRKEGRSAWSLHGLFSYGRSALISFSSLPLRLWAGLGAFISTISVFYAGYVVFETFVYGRDVPGYATTVTAIFFLGGVQLFSIGILGEYLASLFDEVKGRPVYLISESHKSE